MDELAKKEARNYLSAAGLFILGGYFLLEVFVTAFNNSTQLINQNIFFALGIGMIIVATLLAILQKRDMLAILFMLMGFLQFFLAFYPSDFAYIIVEGFILLVAIITLTSKDNKKWLLFLIPAIMFIGNVVNLIMGGNNTVFSTIVCLIITVLCFYYAFCFASERAHLPGHALLTKDENTNFKSSGSVLGYSLFALIAAVPSFYFIFGESFISLASVTTLVTLGSIMLIFIAILLLTIGKMRFTPIMFLLIGITLLLSCYSTGIMAIGIGILIVIVGIFAMLRKESRILPGIMLAVFGFGWCFYPYLPSGISITLFFIPLIIAIYLAFFVYSERNMPKI